MLRREIPISAAGKRNLPAHSVTANDDDDDDDDDK
jgi:hypothetical protein